MQQPQILLLSKQNMHLHFILAKYNDYQSMLL